MLRSVMSDDNELCGFLCALLEEKHVKDKGNIIGDNKGIMAGTPLSAFYANLYMFQLFYSFLPLAFFLKGLYHLM